MAVQELILWVVYSMENISYMISIAHESSDSTDMK